MLSAGACSTALAARLQLSIDISCPQAAHQQTRWPLLLLSTDGTDRRTPDHYRDTAPHTVQVVSEVLMGFTHRSVIYSWVLLLLQVQNIQPIKAGALVFGW